VLWIVGTAAGLLLVLVLLVGVWVWRNQERVVFQPQRGPFPPEPRGARRIAYAAADGQPLFGYVVGPAGAADVVVAFHGNADLAVRWVPWAEELARRTGAAVLLAEYRGYAGLGGQPTYEGALLDARAAWAAARDSLGARPEWTSLFGHSLGSAVAAGLAMEMGGAPRSLALQSPFTSAQAMARVIAGRPMQALWSAVSRVHFDTEARVRETPAPVWVSHGTRDFVIPVRMGRAVFAAARAPGGLLVVDGASHNDVVERGGERYWTWLVEAATRTDRAASRSDTPSHAADLRQ
jgi:alpha-beta hydrolase superfamily lysophospholipase